MKKLALIIIMASALSFGFALDPERPTIDRALPPPLLCDRVSGPHLIDVGVSGKYSGNCTACEREDDGGFFGCSSIERYDPDYRFDWGDGVVSSWGPRTRNHSWSEPGIYFVSAQARCDGKTSDWSPRLGVEVLPACTVVVAVPNGGESWTKGDIQQIEWTSMGDCGSTVSIYLQHGEGSGFCKAIANNLQNTGSYDWTVEQCFDYENDYKICVKDDYSGKSDASDDFFSIPLSVRKLDRTTK